MVILMGTWTKLRTASMASIARRAATLTGHPMRISTRRLNSMANWIGTTVMLSEELGVGVSMATKLLKTITPVRKIGTAYEISDADMRRLKNRPTTPGPKPKKASKK